MDAELLTGRHRSQDTFTLTAPASGAVCHALTCRNRTPPSPAAVRVEFGWFPRLWPESWGRTYDMCESDWRQTLTAARKSRQVVVDDRRPGGGQSLCCLECGLADPPPEQTCRQGKDHFVGRRGCANCGRLTEACGRRPCSARRAGEVT